MATQDSTCSVVRCENKSLARGWCAVHYRRWARAGVLNIPPRFPRDLCSVGACRIEVKANGLCSTHYQRMRTTGEAGIDSIKVFKRPVVDGQKQCGSCGVRKPVSEFNKNASGSGGVTTKCRLCLAVESRAWFAANPGYQKDWRAKNPDSSRDNVQFRRAKRMDVDAELIDRREVFERDGNVCKLCEEPMDMSQKAPHPLAPSIDHILAISRGGTHTMGNIQSAHFYCNSSKGDRDAPLTKPPLAA